MKTVWERGLIQANSFFCRSFEEKRELAGEFLYCDLFQKVLYYHVLSKEPHHLDPFSDLFGWLYGERVREETKRLEAAVPRFMTR